MEWNPEQIKLAIEQDMIPTAGEAEPTYMGVAQDRLTSALPFAVDTLVYLCTYSQNENMRYKAATAIIDRVMGRADADGLLKTEEKTTLEQFAGIVKSM